MYTWNIINTQIIYRKQEKIRWVKLLQFSQFLSLPQKFSHEFLALGK